MNQKILETDRLYLRLMNVADAANVFELNKDPLVIRYTGDKAFESVEMAENFLLNYKDYQLYQVGRWAVIRKEDEAWLGWCGLKFVPATGEINLGYRLLQRYWDNGYATEAAIACIHYGFARFNYPFIVGCVEKENIGSIRVLEKAGLHFWKESEVQGKAELYYKIDNEGSGIRGQESVIRDQ